MPRENRHLFVAALCLLVIAVAVASMLRGSRPTAADRVRADRFNTMATASAEEAVKFLDDGENAVILSMGGPYEGKFGEIEKIFRRSAEKQGVEILATESLYPGSDASAIVAPGSFTGATLLSLMARHPNAEAVISLVGAPHFNADEYAALPNPLPKVIVARGAFPGSGLEAMMRAGIVSMAIVPRPQEGSTPSENTGNGREWFDRFFQIVTTDNVSKAGFTAL